MKSTIKIQNLKCYGCANTITKKLTLLENISDVEVNNDEQTVSFRYENEADLVLVKSTLQSLGYPEFGETNSLGEKAKSFVSCAVGRIS
ncbi:MAG TPA: heavy metal-associated domain-containing protein [Flavobacterium sp.]|uniref:heavy-metal-associated domain-containing protein n=1 Tax=unclassified Flavobacterium TaxID=196869 RepID=UPI000E97BFE5|nr:MULTISPECIES: heavy metal-associated domain-containing protein [unclassified Flavobacterium]HBI00897.1 heavy metal transporter [Flavobacterium sp.]HRE76740.1 heavy metal-associated domain-containing protein [Flavobacterium sp.]